MHSSEEGVGAFGITGGNAAPAFEVQEGVFDEVSCLVKCFVILPLFLAVAFGRNLHLHALFARLGDDVIAVVATIRQQMFCAESVNQLVCLGAVCDGSGGNDDPKRHTKRIHGKVELAVEPPFVTPMS